MERPTTSQIISKVRHIELKTNRPVEGLISGAYHSAFKGTGIEFSQVREYQAGDDPRTIDWNVTARMDHPFVKEFIEERDLTIVIVFDISRSSEFATIGSFRIIRETIFHEPVHDRTDLSVPLVKLSRILKKKSVIFVISDFQDDPLNLKKPLRVLKNRHDIIAVKLWDIREQELPDIGLIELEDEETGEQILVDTADAGFRMRFKEMVEYRNKKLSHITKRLDIDMIEISTHEDWIKPILKFFKMRVNR